MNGIDTPTLRDAWATAPYLHNGSAATIEAAIQSHSNLVLTATELANVAAYTRQLDRAEAAAPSSTANLVVRMMSSIADKFGSLFEVRVNGNTVGQGQIEARTWVDVFFDTVRIAQNAVIEVVFNERRHHQWSGPQPERAIGAAQWHHHGQLHRYRRRR